MRDPETIDSELRLLLAIRRMVREAEGHAKHRADRRAVRRALGNSSVLKPPELRRSGPCSGGTGPRKERN